MSYQQPPQPGPHPGYQQPAGYQQHPGYGGSPYGPPQETRKHGGLATAALVTGIIGFVLGCIPFVNYVAFPLVLLAIVFGAIGFAWGKGKAGLILGLLGLAATILWSVAIAGAFNKATRDYNNYSDCLKHASTSEQIQKCEDDYTNN